MLRIAIPDDAPPVMRPSAACRTLEGRALVTYFDSLPSSEEELIARIGDNEALISIRASAKLPETVLRQCPALKLVSIFGTGTDHVDLGAASRLGITVTNTPGVSAYAMAEHCLALMLAVARNIPNIDRETRAGHWPRGMVSQLHGKTLGIIGLGAIGRQTARLGLGIGMRVIAWTMHPSRDLAGELGVELVAIDDLCRESDVVSLHLRLSEETRGMIGRPQFDLMKPSAIFINTARGSIVDEAAMTGALRERRIAGAGLDVFDREPLPAGHPLATLPNVVLTPHSGGVTAEALEAGLLLAIDNVFAFFERKPQNIATAPP